MGTILIPVPILGATVGGVVGSVGGKLLGDVTGIALSKILEVYEKLKESKMKKMTTISQLMVHISPESDLVQGLMNIAMDRDEEEAITNVVQEAISPTSTSIYPSLRDIEQNNPNATPEKCQAAAQLTCDLFTDSNSFDYFVLTPVRDENGAEEFASSTDLLVLRWPRETVQPWESNGEQVLDIDDSKLNQE